MRVGTGREGRPTAGLVIKSEDGMGRRAAESAREKNPYFSNCCLFPLEGMRIINEFPIKKNYTREKEAPGPGCF